MHHRTSTRGFTLIELISVITLLAILAVTALPKFINFQKDAHEANFQAIYTAFKSGVDSYHLTWALRGGTTATPIKEYQNLLASSAGYPYGLTVRDRHRPRKAQDCVDIYNGVLQTSGISISAGGSNGQSFGSETDVTAALHQKSCVYLYTAIDKSYLARIPIFIYYAEEGRIVKRQGQVLR